MVTSLEKRVREQKDKDLDGSEVEEEDEEELKFENVQPLEAGEKEDFNKKQEDILREWEAPIIVKLPLKAEGFN